MKCDIIIPVWNLLDLTRECFESINLNTRYPYKIIIIDNGSENATKNYLEDLSSRDSRISLIRNEENLGFVKANNQGIKVSDSPYLCLLNNDTLVQDGWLSEMVRIIEDNKDIGIVNPASNTMGHKPVNDSLGVLERYARETKERFSDKFIELGSASGFCLFTKRGVTDRIGNFNEKYGLGYFEDSDFSQRAKKQGYKIVCALGSYVYHREGSSFKSLNGSKGLFEKNREIFFDQFGKPKRVLYILTQQNLNCFEKIEKQTQEYIKGFNWIRIFIKKSLRKPILIKHAHLRIISFNALFFRMRCIFNILVKKKKFTHIYVDDNKIFKILNRLELFHKAKLEFII